LTHFGDQIISLVGKQVRLGRGGPDERRGSLEGVMEDYLVLLTQDGRVHYPLHHLKSVTEVTGGNDTQEGSDGFTEDPLETLPRQFNDLMHSFLGQKIQVYDHGPESAAGFVFEVGDNFVKLVTGPDEMVHYPFFHIRSVRISRAKSDNGGDGDKGDGSGGKGRSGGGRGSRGGRSDGRTGTGGRTGGRRTGGRTGKGTGKGTGGRGQRKKSKRS